MAKRKIWNVKIGEDWQLMRATEGQLKCLFNAVGQDCQYVPANIVDVPVNYPDMDKINAANRE